MSEENKPLDSMKWDEHLRAGVKGLKEEVRESMGSREALDSARKHGRAAAKEMLLAWRSLIDGAIGRIDQVEQNSTKHATRINID
jgi:hypothetical protein